MIMQAVRTHRSHFEIWFTIVMLVITLGLAWFKDLPLIMPTKNSASFVGIHYLIPVLGVFLWAFVALLKKDMKRVWTFLVALPCYALVLWCHFNIKLWAPLINNRRYDQFYWDIDTVFRPIVDAAINLRLLITPIIPLESNFYMIGFIAMFYISFIMHAFRSYESFRNLFIAALIFQGLGAISYLIAPALGPFIYESGVDFPANGAQQNMLQFHQYIMSGGRDWLAENGSPGFTAGLAAMPSLHSGGAFLFFVFACRQMRLLAPMYAGILAFILIGAISTRWHYLIDVPAGILLAWFAIRLADYICGKNAQFISPDQDRVDDADGWITATPAGQR